MTTIARNPKPTSRPRMTEATIAARANARAHTEHVHIFAIPGRPGVFTTKSKSNPAQRYTLVLGPDDNHGCSCKGFEYRQSCKHVEALRNRLARGAVAAARAARHVAGDCDVCSLYNLNPGEVCRTCGSIG